MTDDDDTERVEVVGGAAAVSCEAAVR